MKYTLINFIKRIIPETIVRYIKTWRKTRRIQSRFKINQGKDILTNIKIGNNSFSIYINPYLNGGVDDDIQKFGIWEPEITDLISKYLLAGQTFVDIGANIGYHSLYASTIVGEKGKIVSYEPLLRLGEQMNKSIKENNFSNIKIYNVALSDKIGKAKLSLVSENVGASSIQVVENDRDVEGEIEVNIDLLDNFSDKFTRLDMIKIDIEGNEFEALRGAEKLLKKFSPTVILEFSPHVYEKDYVGKTYDFYKYLISLNYQIKRIDDISVNIEDDIKNGCFKDLHTNLICTANSR